VGVLHGANTQKAKLITGKGVREPLVGENGEVEG